MDKLVTIFRAHAPVYDYHGQVRWHLSKTMQMGTGRQTCCLGFYAARLAHMRHGQSYRENYYDVLNVPSNSSNKEIKEAFIELSKKYHPDANTQTCNTEQFVRVCEAYQILHKDSLRSQYDKRLQKSKYSNMDTCYSNSNVHKSWQQYRAAMRNKQLGYNIKIKNSSSGVKLRGKPMPAQTKRINHCLPALIPDSGLDVNESLRQHFCASLPFVSENGGESETDPPSEWSLSCYIAGFGLMSGLLFMDDLSDWCYKQPAVPTVCPVHS